LNTDSLYYYKSGLPFDTKLAENLKDLDHRVSGNKASLLVVDGGVGQGKTTLNVHCGDYINKLNGLGPIDFSDKKCPQIAFGGSEFLKKMRVCFEKKLPYIVYTEAGDFSRRGSMTRFNNVINRAFETFRAFKIIVGLDLPNFNVLDNLLFDNQIPRLLLHTHDRVSDIDCANGRGYGNFKAYSLYRMLLLKAKMEKLKVKPFAFQQIDANFRGHFLNLTPARSKKLDLISIRSKKGILLKAEIEVEGLLSYSDMAMKLCRSLRWVKDTINLLKIQPSKTLRQAKYFKPDVLNILAEQLEKLEARDKRLK